MNTDTQTLQTPDPNNAAAALALATHLSTQLATPQQDAPQAPETPLQTLQDTHQAPDLSNEVADIQKQIEGIQKALQKDETDDQKEIASIRQELEELKNEPES